MAHIIGWIIFAFGCLGMVGNAVVAWKSQFKVKSGTVVPVMAGAIAAGGLYLAGTRCWWIPLVVDVGGVPVLVVSFLWYKLNKSRA